jgi:hypothetical protein
MSPIVASGLAGLPPPPPVGAEPEEGVFGEQATIRANAQKASKILVKTLRLSIAIKLQELKNKASVRWIFSL